MPNNVQSGWFSTPTNTPTGARKQIAVDNPYCSKDDFIQSIEAEGLNLTVLSAAYSNGQIDKLLLRSSAWINRHCRRYFDTQTIDETKTGFIVRPYNPQLITNVLENRPYQNINSIYIQVLKWFIQIDTTPNSGYLQDFPDYGYYKIVPLLSSAGTGMGSPLPAAIVDRIPLGVLWTNYTFGYGTALTAISLTQPAGNTDLKTFQAPLGNRLWAPSQPTTIYKNGVAQLASTYVLDYPNGIVTFNSAVSGGDLITADFLTDESIPSDIREACILIAAHLYGQGKNNPLGATSYGIQTYNINFGDKSSVYKRAEEILEPYVNKLPKII